MKNRASLKKAMLPAAVLAATICSLWATQKLSAQAQTTQSGSTLQDLQDNATSESGNTLQELQERATALEAERSSRTPVYSGGSTDDASPEAAGENNGVGNSGAIARLSSEMDQATIVLTNNTGDEVVYEAIGQTAPRTLAAGESVRLESLPTPITLTAERQNFGLIDMNVTVSAENVLAVDLKGSAFDDAQGALHIRKDGFVFVN